MKWDCSGNADPVVIEGNKIYSYAGGKKCGLEWQGGKPDSSNHRNAKWDCSGNADHVVIEGNKIYTYVGGKHNDIKPIKVKPPSGPGPF